DISNLRSSYKWIETGISNSEIWSLQFMNVSNEKKITLKSSSAKYLGHSIDKMNGNDTVAAVFSWAFLSQHSDIPFKVNLKVSIDENKELSYWSIVGDIPPGW